MSIYLIEIQGWNPSKAGGAGVDTLRVATDAYTTRPTDTPADAYYEKRVATALNVEQAMYASGTTGGPSEVGFGAVELLNQDGALDHLLDWGFSGRAITVKSVADASTPLASAATVFRGTLEQAEFSLARVTFRVRDRLAELKVPLCASRLRGDNDATLTPIGINGTPEAEGTIRPVCLGVRRNVPVVPVCPQKLVHQANDGPVQSIGPVYVSGDPLAGNVLRNGEFDVDQDSADPGDWLLNRFSPYSQITEGVMVVYGSSKQAFGFTEGCEYTLTVGLWFLAEMDDVRLGISFQDADFSSTMTVLSPTTYANPNYGSGEYRQELSFTVTPPAGTVYIVFSQYTGVSNVPVLEYARLKPVVVDYADRQALEAATVPGGGYATCVAEGIFRLATNPGGTVTADVVGATAGRNLVANPYFDDASGWTVAGGWTVDAANHRAVKATGATTDSLTCASFAAEAGGVYQVRFRVRDYTGGAVYASIGGVNGASMSSAGLYAATITASTAAGLVIHGGPSFGGAVTDVDVRLIRFTAEADHTAANLIEILLRDHVGLPASDLDAASFAALHTACPQLVGHRADDESATVLEAIDALCRSVGAWLAVTPAGLVRVGRFVAPAGTPVAELVAEASALESGGMERLATNDAGSGLRVRQVNVHYQFNHEVMESSRNVAGQWVSDDLVGVVTADETRRTWLGREWRTASASDPDVPVEELLAPEMTVDTGLDDADDAAAEAARLLALHSVRRDRVKIRVPSADGAALALGDVVSLTADRWFTAGKLMRVIGKVAVLDGSQDTYDLDLWG